MSAQVDAASRPALILAFAILLGLWVIGLSGQDSRLGVARMAADTATEAFQAQPLRTAKTAQTSHEAQSAQSAQTVQPAQTAQKVQAAQETAVAQKAEAGSAARNTVAKKPPRLLTHAVKPGETLGAIARSYGISARTIEGVNDLANPNMLKVGQQLRILSVDGTLHKVGEGETLWGISRRYSVSVAKILAANPSVNPDRLAVGAELILPGVVARATANVASAGSGTGASRAGRSNGLGSRGVTLAFAWPVIGRITSYFGSRWGSFHEGIDIAASSGVEVHAAAPGRVVYSGWYGSYGKLIIIDHGNGYRTRYGHNSTLMVSRGDMVSRGQPIARVGSTGRATGPHLHFEVRRNGQAVNPTAVLP